MPVFPCLAQIVLFAGNFAPRGWALCDGQLLAINGNQALFSLLGTTYGGDGRTTFGLPDLRGRAPVHVGTGPGLSVYSWGSKTGAETSSVSGAQLPSHAHTASTIGTAKVGPSGEISPPPGMIWATSSAGDNDYSTQPPTVAMDANAMSGQTTLGSAGGGQAHTNIQPLLAINYIIALQGVYPSRN